MAKEKIDLRDKLRAYKSEFDLLQKIPCTKQENEKYQQLLKNGETLPDGVFAYADDPTGEPTTEFYTVCETDLTEAEIKEYLTYKQLRFIRTIKNCVVFFTVLTIIGMVACFLTMMNAR
ncbi:MAG: hypothetical protein IKT68_04395 [Clostridia bacterium]|nr:hypothetical protein [Clostridia bacterium]